VLIENFPVVSFHGPGFEFDEDSKRIRNLLHDLFNRGSSPREGDLLGLTRLYISVVYEDNVMHFRFYISKIVTSMMEKSAWTSEVRCVHQNFLEEIGPRLDMVIRRKLVAPEDVYKQAISRKSYLTQKAVRLH